MPLKINTEINLSVILSALTGIIAVVVFAVSMKGDIKTLTAVHTADVNATALTIKGISEELGEIRRLHLQAALRTSAVEKEAQKATLLATNNTKKIDSHNEVLTKVAAAVSISVPEEIKKKTP